MLQSDEIPRFLFGLGACAVAGAALALVAGGSIARGLAAVVAPVFVGAILYELMYAFPAYGFSEEPVWAWPFLIILTSVYLGVPAAAGAALAGAAHALVVRVRRRRGEERQRRRDTDHTGQGRQSGG